MSSVKVIAYVELGPRPVFHPFKDTCDCRPRRVEVVKRLHNHSAFNGYHYTPSDRSKVRCLTCGQVWRTAAGYASVAPDAKDACCR